MPTADEVARARYSARQRLVDAAARAAFERWARVDPADIAASWRAQLWALTLTVSGAQLAAASGSDDYLSEVLAAQDIEDAATGQVNARALAGVASDGRDLMSLLYQPAITALMAIGAGASPSMGMASGWATLDMMVRTQVADAGRVADGVALTGRKTVQGYVRLVVGRTCSRCIVLAGKWFDWNAGFQRHPRCDCVHVPTTREVWRGKSRPGDDPKALVADMTRAEQDRVFTAAGAQAIRDGADIGQAVNARRGMYTAGGQKMTGESTTKRGVMPGKARLMPEEIYRQSLGDREGAIRLLRLHRYLV